MKTAVDLIEDKLKLILGEEANTLKALFVIMKEVEREQIEQAFNKGRFSKRKAQQYYTETYAISNNNT
jgi:hypothetical protein